MYLYMFYKQLPRFVQCDKKLPKAPVGKEKITPLPLQDTFERRN